MKYIIPFPLEYTIHKRFLGVTNARVSRCFSWVSPAFGPLDCHTTPVALQCQGAFPWPLRAAVSGPSLAIGGPGWKVRELANGKTWWRQHTPQQERSEISKQLLIKGGFFLGMLTEIQGKALQCLCSYSLNTSTRPLPQSPHCHRWLQKVMIPPEQWSNLMPFHHTARFTGILNV